MGFSSKPSVTVIVPAFNEAENISPLLAELSAKLPRDYDVIIVDDGSADATYETAVAAQAQYQFLTVLRHRTNLGKTAAIMTGMEKARGEFVSVFDADLQFRPEDVVAQADKLREGWDLVTGRKQGKYEKRFVSSIYNWLARGMFGINVHDINALKTFRREVLEGVSLRKDWHRYIVPLAAARGFRITEIPVVLRPRQFGEAKYSGRARILVGLFDLVAVAFQLTFMRKPLLYFGVLGTGALALGFLAGLVAVMLRLAGHGFRPLLYLVILLVVAGLVLFAAGFLGESLAGISDRLERLERLARKQNETDGTNGTKGND
jgi:glycosyltransferase involved in cell wall biosynthesis